MVGFFCRFISSLFKFKYIIVLLSWLFGRWNWQKARYNEFAIWNRVSIAQGTRPADIFNLNGLTPHQRWGCECYIISSLWRAFVQKVYSTNIIFLMGLLRLINSELTQHDNFISHYILPRASRGMKEVEVLNNYAEIKRITAVTMQYRKLQIKKQSVMMMY